MENLGKNEDLNQLLSSTPVCILQFGDDGCMPCHVIRKKLEVWLKDHPQVTARYVNVADHLELASRMNVFNVPAVYVFAEGKPALEQAGYFSVLELLEKTERLIRLLGS